MTVSREFFFCALCKKTFFKSRDVFVYGECSQTICIDCGNSLIVSGLVDVVACQIGTTATLQAMMETADGGDA